MSSQSGLTIAAPQVIVNKAAKKIVIDRKGGNGRKRKDLSENSVCSEPLPNKEPKISGAVADDLEEGEIDADVPSIVASSCERPEPALSKSQVISKDASMPIIISPPTNGEQDSVKKKLTALERLKSLSFATSKSAVNPFTLSTPKPPATTVADYKTDKKNCRQRSPSLQQSLPALPPKKPRQQDHPGKVAPFERQPRYAGRSNLNFDDGQLGTTARFNRRYRRPSPLSGHRDLPFSASESGPPPVPFGAPSVHGRFDNLGCTSYNEMVPVMEATVDCRLPPSADNYVPIEERTTPNSSFRISADKIRELIVSAEELNNASISDLRGVVQHLLEKEAKLIHLHLRLHDQMKNVRRTLDRQKHIEQLKKQALAATLAAKKAKEMEANDLKKLDSNTRSAVDNCRLELDGTDISTDEQQPAIRMNLEDALKNSVFEQAAARKAHLLEYLQSARGHHSTGTSFEQDPRYGLSSGQQQSSGVSKEKFTAMLQSFFEGVASMAGRSVFHDSSAA